MNCGVGPPPSKPRCTPFASSFRDPDGALVSVDGRLLRFVKPSAASDLRAFLCTETARRFSCADWIVRSAILEDLASLDPAIRLVATEGAADFESTGMVLEHQRI